ncbi:MAG TPA: thioredoxin [Acidobacteriota bacterium]
MSEAIIELTADNFEAEVLKSETPVLVDFWAEWCAPCRMLAPTIEQVASDYGDRIKVGKLNVDHFGDIAARYQIRGIPTILVFHRGEVHDQMVGAGSKENIVRMVDKVTAPTTA